MKRIFFIMIALMATLAISAQTIEVYEYDRSGNLNNVPAYTYSKRVKVIFKDNNEEEHDYIDLGLPSGTLWATCNIGANSPEDYGLYFAWGETTGYGTSDYHQFNAENYKWCNRQNKLDKYCNKNLNGNVDNRIELEYSDDAATANWGGNWCMPTNAQQEELINPDYTTTEWTTQNGVKGCKITSKINGNSIFLPAAGYRSDANFYNQGKSGGYWSCELYLDSPVLAYLLQSSSYGSGAYDCGGRYGGRTIRPVRCPK